MSLESSFLSSERTSVRARTAAVCHALVEKFELRRTELDAYLLVDNSSQAGLALDDGIGNAHLPAQGRQEDDELDGVDVVGNKDKSSLLVLDQADNVVETVLDSIWLLADVLLLLALLDGRSLLEETLLLLGLRLRSVLVQDFEGLGGGVAVKDMLELGDRRRHLEAQVDDLALALETDILGPLHHAGEVAARLNVLTDTEVSGSLLDEGVLVHDQHHGRNQ